jgi:hypothetical protein
MGCAYTKKTVIIENIEMNIEQFYSKIYDLSKSNENRDLEYLLAVYKNVLKHKDSEPTLELVLRVLCDSFTSELMRFELEWLKIIEAPDRNRMSRKFTNPEFSSKISKTNTS